MSQHFVMVGALARIGRFSAPDASVYPRDTRVICRTERGLEVGRVLSHLSGDATSDGLLLRRVTVEDELLLARLDRRRDEAFQACVELLRARGLSAVLVDVEHLFDGKSLYFYFLGEVSHEVESVTSDLAVAYEAEVQFEQFAETLSEGCGPDCGTDAAAGGCASQGCASCAVAEACGSRAK